MEEDKTVERFMMIEKFLNELVGMRQQIRTLKASEAQYQAMVAALRESESKYKTIVENIPQKVFLKDKNSVYVSCNENYARDLKIEPEGIVGKTDYAFFPGEMAEKYISEDQRIMEVGKPQESDEAYLSNGQELIVHMVRTPVKDEKGDIVGILGIFWDITDQRRSEEELKKLRGRLEELESQHTRSLETINRQLQQANSERKEVEERLRRSEGAANRLSQENMVIEKFGRVVRSALDIEEVYGRFAGFAEEVGKLILFDRVTITIMNPEDNTLTMTYVSGPAGPDIAGQRAGDVFPMAGTLAEEVIQNRSSLLIQPESARETTEQFPDFLPYFRAGFQSMLSVPLTSKDGVMGVLSFLSTRQNAYTEMDLRVAERIGTEIAAAIAKAQIFLERKQAEEALQKYRFVVDHSTVGIWILQDEKLIFVNPKCTEILGYSAEELTSKPLAAFLHPDDRESETERYSSWLKGEMPLSTYRYRFLHKDGSIKWLETKAALVRWEGRPAIINFATDFTEYRQAEEELRRSVEQFRTLVSSMEEKVFKWLYL